MENSSPGMFVLKAYASDPDVGANSEISYTLHGPNADKFHLEHRTGMKTRPPAQRGFRLRMLSAL